MPLQDGLIVPPSGAARRGDWLALVRPRLATLGLIIVALAYAVAQPNPFDVPKFGLLMVGSLLALCGASALNQAMEWEADGRMRRTADRPVPSGRWSSRAAMTYGLLLVGAGLWLLTFINGLCAWAAFSGVASYVGLYTPLKPRTTLATVVGAVPGAIPTLMGWSAATGNLDPIAWSLFWILFLWQMPHFLAVAWMYRRDYQRAGFRMLTDHDPGGDATVRQVIGYGLALIPVSLMPTLIGPAGLVYFVGALVLGLAYLAFGLRLASERTGLAAKALLKASVIYLPLLFMLLAADVLLG
jgi:protoheme IX farnesyltransferase